MNPKTPGSTRPATLELPVIQREPQVTAGQTVAEFLPPSPRIHLFESQGERYLFVTDRSRVFRLDPDSADRLDDAVERRSDAAVVRQLESLGIFEQPPLEVLEEHPLTSLSLAVAQKCNLGCTYCYAQEGEFGGAARNMPLPVAKASIERLFEGARPGQTVNLTFLGGEPLVNRRVLQEATEYAVKRSEQTGVRVRFSVTSNGTLLTADDAEFFEKHGFAVTISLDGIGGTHDRLRPYKGGRGSYADVVSRVEPLLARQRNMQVSARVTITPSNLSLLETLNTIISMRFHSVGFSPMLSSPTGRDQMEAPHLENMLEQMVACGREFERRLIAGERYPFSNVTTALQEIHRGTHRPYPCGAGAGYFGVSAEGGLFACHRFVDDDAGSMGSIQHGVDGDRQSEWLTGRQVDRQEPCRSCWARYLCGGGCHHEVIHRGRPACDYIRGWLDYCLQAYVRLLKAVPSYFGNNGPRPGTTDDDGGFQS